MVDTMPETNVFDPYSGSEDRAVRSSWRTNRRAAYWLSYKELQGKAHPAVKMKGNKAILDALLENTEPPRGMTWAEFGVLWDLHPEQVFTPVLRKKSVTDEWNAIVEEHAEELPTT